MKRYQSHKVVEAARINSCGFEADGSGWIQYTDTDGEEVQFDAPRGFLRPGAACEPGDYLVRYQPDGYLSWSPRAVFEAGYKLMDQPAPGNTWQSRAMDELEQLTFRLDGLRKALLAGTVTDQHALSLMQRQYKAMDEYAYTLTARLRYCGVISPETPPTVREAPQHVSVQIEAPAGKRATVTVTRDDGNTSRFTVVGGQRQAWECYTGDVFSVGAGEDHGTVAAKRGAV